LTTIDWIPWLVASFTFPLRLADAGLTARGDHAVVRRCLIPVVVAAVALVVAAAAAAGRLTALPKLPPGWSHAEINVIIKRVPHTLIYDRGRVLAVTATALTLRERDGSVVTIDVSPSSRITIKGRAASLTQIRRLETATTIRVDGGAATRVSVTIPKAATAPPAARKSGPQAHGRGGKK
jgi:hypothetical protein